MSFRRLPVRLQSIKEKERKTEALAYLLRNLDDFSASMLQNSVVVRRILTSVFRSFSLTDCTAHSNAFEKTYAAADRKLRLDLPQLGATGKDEIHFQGAYCGGKRMELAGWSAYPSGVSIRLPRPNSPRVSFPAFGRTQPVCKTAETMGRGVPFFQASK